MLGDARSSRATRRLQRVRARDSDRRAPRATGAAALPLSDRSRPRCGRARRRPRGAARHRPRDGLPLSARPPRPPFDRRDRRRALRAAERPADDRHAQDALRPPAGPRCGRARGLLRRRRGRPAPSLREADRGARDRTRRHRVAGRHLPRHAGRAPSARRGVRQRAVGRRPVAPGEGDVRRREDLGGEPEHDDMGAVPPRGRPPDRARTSTRYVDREPVALGAVRLVVRRAAPRAGRDGGS